MKQMMMLESRESSGFHSPEELLNMNETNKDLYKAIHKLKKSYRDVIILRGIKELTIEETAEILNWKFEKVRLTFHRAIKALQKEREGFCNVRR